MPDADLPFEVIPTHEQPDLSVRPTFEDDDWLEEIVPDEEDAEVNFDEQPQTETTETS